MSAGGENVILDQISIDALQFDKDLSKELDARKKILTWVEYSAYDKILAGKTAGQVKESIAFAKRQLAEADASIAAKRKSVHVVKRVPKSKQTIQYWKNECANKNPPIPVKATLKKPEYEKCCSPNATLANIDQTLCLSKKMGKPVKHNSFPGLPVIVDDMPLPKVSTLKADCEQIKGIKLLSKVKSKSEIERCCSPAVMPSGCVPSSKGHPKMKSPKRKLPSLPPQLDASERKLCLARALTPQLFNDLWETEQERDEFVRYCEAHGI